MENTPLTVAAWPRAILHVDADAFFASVEEALVPALRGRPVVTGQERGIIACANYAAKAAGVQRGVQLHIARRMCPGLVVLPSDYETYGLFSRRMFAIMRRFTPQVEEYSIDEAFLDITGMRRVFRASYEEIAQRLQRTIREELDITVSVGLSLSKGLAKLCSKFRKPCGFTAVPGLYIHLLLQRTALAKVWGFGPNTVSLLEKQGLRTAYDFVRQPEPWVQRWLHKPGRDLWHELRGDSVWPVSGEEPPPQATVMRSKTFTPPSDDPEFVFARLTRNVEAAFAKLRRHRMRARAVGVVLRRQDFRHDGLEARLNRAARAALEIMPLLRGVFDRVFQAGTAYRSTLIVLGRLEADAAEQYELFEDPVKVDSLHRLAGVVDTLNARYGRQTVSAGNALFLNRPATSARDDLPARRRERLPGETEERRLALPRLDLRV